MPMSKPSMLDLAGEQEDTSSPFLFQQEDDYAKLYVAIRQPTLELLEGDESTLRLLNRKGKAKPVRVSSQPLLSVSHTSTSSIDINCNPSKTKRPAACGQSALMSGLPEVPPGFSRSLYRTADRIAKNAVKKAQVGKERARRSPATAYPMERRSSSDSVHRSRAILRVSSAPDAWQTHTEPVASSSKEVASAHAAANLHSAEIKHAKDSRMRHSAATTSVSGDLSMVDASAILADGDLSMLDIDEPLTPTDVSFICSGSSTDSSVNGSIAHGTTPSRWTPTQPHVVEAASTQRTRPAISRAVSASHNNTSTSTASSRRHEATFARESSNSPIPSELPAVTAKNSPNVGRARLGMSRRVVPTTTSATTRSSTSPSSRQTFTSPATTTVDASAAKHPSYGAKTPYKSPGAQPARAPPPVTRLLTPDDTPPDPGCQADSSFEYDAPSWDAEDWDILMKPHVSQ